jgi:hypothetical protein
MNSGAIPSIVIQLALAPFVVFILILVVFIFLKNRK